MSVIPNHSNPYTAPTISMMESSAPTSWRCTRSIGVPWIAASASARRSNSETARSWPESDSDDRLIAAIMCLR